MPTGRALGGRLAGALVALIGLTASAGCDAEPPPSESSASTAGESPMSATPNASEASPRFIDLEERFPLNDKLLPAHRVAGAPTAFKGDQFDDTRLANPQYFAITEPPDAGRPVRPMVEWEPMRAIVMAYPGYMLTSQNATQTFVQIARHSVDAAEVWFFVDTSSAENGLKTRILNAGVDQDVLDDRVKFFRHPIDSVWFIDSGPLPIIDTDEDTWAIADFRYYHERPLDDAIPTVMARDMGEFGYAQTTTAYRMPLTTEGGTLQATTDGVCFTGNRQLYYMSCEEPGGCDEQIRTTPLDEIQDHPLALEMAETLAEYAGCEDLIITHSVTDDGTGHIDIYMKILDDERVLMAEYREPFDDDTHQELNAQRLDDNAAFIEAYVKPDGGRFTVERIIMPGHRGSSFGDIPFTYINSTFLNGVNLWPAYDHGPWDDSRAEAEATWEAVLPDMEHIWIDSTELSFYSGAIHCVTRTVPALEAADWVPDGSCQGDDGCGGAQAGYSGACQPAGVSEDVCWGPAWECACNDCEASCASGGGGDGCDGVSYVGCCDGATLFYCEANELYSAACDTCGWDGQRGFYNCESAGVEPSGTHPRSCDASTCEPDCARSACGDDGCGGSCGTCDEGALCVDGACRDDCVDCAPGAIGCDGEVAWMCVEEEAGCPTTVRFDCAARGDVCADGDCVTPAPDPDPTSSADAATGESDAASGAETSEDDATTDDTTGDAGDAGGAPVDRATDDGCGAGGRGGIFGIVALLGLALVRRGRAGRGRAARCRRACRV